MNFLPSNTDLKYLAAKYKGGYQHANPFPNIVLNNFFNGELINQVLDEFPDLDREAVVQKYDNHNEKSNDWDESYEGYFELWDRHITRAVKWVARLFNAVAVFNTTTYSYYGDFDPLTCRRNSSRKSLSLYYYTNDRPQEEIEANLEDHSTLVVNRCGIKNKFADRLKLYCLIYASDLLSSSLKMNISN